MNVIELSMSVLERSGPAGGGMPPMAHSVGSAALAGVMPDHAAALLVPLLLPLVVGAFFGVVELAARANLRIAHRFLRDFERSTPLTRVTALLLALAGAIHLALVPGHLNGDGTLALGFALDGAALVVAGLAAFILDRWQSIATVLLGASLVAYLFYLGSGREAPDLVGTTTYLVELVALGMAWIPRESSIAERVRDGVLVDGARCDDRVRRGDEFPVAREE